DRFVGDLPHGGLDPPGHRSIDVRVDHKDAMRAYHKATVVHWQLAGQQAVDARRELLRFESCPGGVERWRNKTLWGLGQHLWRCQLRRDQRPFPRVSCLAYALHSYLLSFIG